MVSSEKELEQELRMSSEVIKPKLLPMTEVAEIFGVEPKTIRKWQGRDATDPMPYLKFGKYRYCDPESTAFQEWMNRHRVDNGASRS
jgi:hypothetical protein